MKKLNKRLILCLLVVLLRGVFSLAQTPDTNSVNGLLDLSRNNQTVNRSLSLKYARQAYEKSEPTNPQSRAYAAYQLGFLLRANGQYEEAENLQRESFKLHTEAQDIEKSLRAQLELGRNQYFLRKVPEAAETYTTLLETYEHKISPIHGDRYDDLKAQTLERMGVLSNNQKRFDKAENYFSEAIAINEKRKDSMQLEISYNGLGNVFIYTNQHEKAIPIFENNLKILSRFGRNAGRTYNNLGLCYKALRQFDTATTFFQKAIESYKSNNMMPFYYETLVNVADLYDLRKMPDSAQYYLNMTIPELSRLKSHDALAEAYFEMVVSKTLSADYESALKYQKMYASLRDSLSNNLSQANILEFQKRFDIAKNQELELLRRDRNLRDLQIQKQLLAITNQRLATEKDKGKIALLQKSKELQEAEIAKTTAALKAQEDAAQIAESQLVVKEKDRQLHEQAALEAQKDARILRGVLAAVLAVVLLVGFLIYKLIVARQKEAATKEKLERERLQNEAQQTLNQVRMETLRAQMNPHFMFNCLNAIEGFVLENKKWEASKLIQKFSKLMRLVLDNSLHPTVPLEKDLEALRLYLDLEKTRYAGTFDYNITTDDEALDTPVPPLLIQPFVENSILHGLRHRNTEGGYLTIEIAQNAKELVFNISDNGIGREKSALLKQQAGRLLHNSVGLKLTTERLKMFAPNSTIEVNDLDPKAENVGTQVLIKLIL